MTDAPPTEKRPKRLPSNERRREFVAKAIEFFAEEGFESSTRELARRLGVTQPLLYRYFPSKDNLIAEVYEAVYVGRWREEWGNLIRDRSRPIDDRLRQFYREYTDVVFNRDWMRIFVFSGLKGVDINKRYMRLVHERILEPVVRETRLCANKMDVDPIPTEKEVELARVMHGAIYYYGVHCQIYGIGDLSRKGAVIDDAIAAYLPLIRKESKR